MLKLPKIKNHKKTPKRFKSWLSFLRNKQIDYIDDAVLKIGDSYYLNFQESFKIQDILLKIVKLKEKLLPQTKITWQLPIENPWGLEELEGKHLFELLADILLVTREDGNYKFSGEVKKNAAALIMRWPIFLANDPSRLKKIFKCLKQASIVISQAVHLIEVSDKENSEFVNKKYYQDVLDFFKDNFRNNVLGIFIPNINLLKTKKYLKKIKYFFELLDQRGLKKNLQCQAFGNYPQLTDTENLLSFAYENNIKFDFSLYLNEMQVGLTPYFKYGGYFPLSFDIRAPSFIPIDKPVVEVAKHHGESIVNEIEADGIIQPHFRAESITEMLFNSVFCKYLKRIYIALNEKIKQNYINTVNHDVSQVGFWPKHSIFNWASFSNCLALVEFNIQDLTNSDSALCRAINNKYLDVNDSRIISGNQILGLIQDQANRFICQSNNLLLEEQITGHGYLADGGREDVTKDGEKLIEILPKKINKLLELGCGFGVMAKNITSRVEEYYGIDLSIRQAKHVAKYKVKGLVADIHDIPFSSNCFDAIIADNVIEHSYDPIKLLEEIKRVLTVHGNLFAIIPLDFLSSKYQLKLHLWKADQLSIRKALKITGFHVVHLEELAYARIGVHGSFPGSLGRTCLLHCQAIK